MLEGALSFKFQSAWEHVLGVLETFYFLAGKDCHKFMTKVYLLVCVIFILWIFVSLFSSH